MHSLSPTSVKHLLLPALLLLTTPLLAQRTVRTVKVLNGKDSVEIEVEASEGIVPQTQVLTGPDRLVVDFPNAIPSTQLHSQSVDRGGVKDVRVGLFQHKPPVTRIVLDLKTAQSYEVFPYGRTVMIKVMSEAKVISGPQENSEGVDNFPPEPTPRPGLVAANYTPGSQHVSIENTARPTLDVSFRNGLLGIRANMVSLSQVLLAVQQRTGADVSMAPGADQETIVTDIAPAPAPEALARLLNGSRFNFLILSATNDPAKLDRVILTMRTEGAVMPLPQMAMQNTAPEEDPMTAAAAPQPGPPIPNPGGPPESIAPPDGNTQPQ